MWISLKVKNPEKFWEEVKEMKDKLIGDGRGGIFTYKTDNGSYNFVNAPVNKDEPTAVYLTFEGKRMAFGKSNSLFSIKRIKRWIRNDKLKVFINGHSYDLELSYYKTSADYKPFWATCSKSDYRALQKLKAR